MKANVPTTIPAIAAPGNPLLLACTAGIAAVVVDLTLVAVVDVVGYDSDEVVVELPSAGKASPGCSMNFESLAPSICVCRGVLAF
jgi:hypothetical protein